MKKNIAINNIAFIGNPTVGTGLWRYAYEIKKQLDLLKLKIDEVTLNYKTLSVDVNGQKILSFKKWIVDYKYFWYLRNQFFIPKYRLYHIANQNLSFLKIFPKVITVYDIFHVSNPSSIQEKLFGMFMYSGIKDAVHLISGSEHTKSEIVKYYKVDPKLITTIYAGVSETYFDKCSDDFINKIKDKYKIPKSCIVFLHVSNEQKHKNFTKILDAIYYLKSNKLLSRFKLIKVGKAQYTKDRLSHIKLINKYNLQKDVIFTEFVPDDDLPALYQLSNIFLFPSEREGFGLPIIESMASGCPVITSNVSSMPEVAGDAAILVNPSSFTELASGIITILDDSILRKSLILKGRINAKKFSWVKTAKDTSSLINKVLKRIND